jgi:hypothetical protein
MDEAGWCGMNKPNFNLRVRLNRASSIISRKIVTASISGSLYAMLLGMINPNPFGETISSMGDYLFSTVTTTPVYLLYSFPVILIYGGLTSILSDTIGQFISRNVNHEKAELTVSGILHLIFGLILGLHSLGAAILFFVTDRVLQKRNKRYDGLQAFKSLALPLAVWLVFMGMVWIEHLLTA